MGIDKTDTPKKRTGRPPKIDAKAEAEILAILSHGASLRDAADYVGIDRSTLTRLKQRSRCFAQGVMQATAKGKIHLLMKISKATQWQAAAWMLERKWAKEFIRRESVDLTTGGKPVKAYVGFDPEQV